jgi:hypothetical protein
VVELLSLRLQVALVVAAGLDFDRDALDDLEPEPSEPHDLGEVVRQQADALQAKFFQDLGPDPVVPQVRGELKSITATPGSWRTFASSCLAGIFASLQVHDQPDSVVDFVAGYVHLVDHVPDQKQTPASGRLQPF